MMALCEVAHTSASSAKDIVKTTDIWVVEDEDAVVTRFFFVFAGNPNPNPNPNPTP